jgi:hypothetical protein
LILGCLATAALVQCQTSSAARTGALDPRRLTLAHPGHFKGRSNEILYRYFARLDRSVTSEDETKAPLINELSFRDTVVQCFVQ